ncbi:type VI secretion system lipoprotein TssJ [Ralstonia flaminis]|nr:type VI secretion system lipoprotein TssJ [Ralstonia sp. LMG 18101]
MKTHTLLVMLAAATLAGCGIAQSVKDGTVDAAKWAFTTQVKTMNLDLTSRASLNPNGAGQPLSTVVRIYQLKDTKTFDTLDYVQLQSSDLQELKADLLATKDVVLRPNASASVSEPMNEDAEFVGVVAFFRDAGKDSTWKLVIPKKQWKKTDPVQVLVMGNTLQPVGAKPEPVQRTAPVQSVPNTDQPESGPQT